MGSGLSRAYHIEDEPIGKPEMYEKYKEDNPDRPIREMVASSCEMDLANLQRDNRDYCAHTFMAHKKCLREWFPEYWRCSHTLHEFHECTRNDQLLRMKEYERVRRLMRRDKLKASAEQDYIIS